MDLGLRDKRYLVTGASTGLGYGVALELAKEQAHVVIAARDADRLRAAADAIAEQTGAPVRWVRTDLDRAEQIGSLVAEAAQDHGLDGLVVNVGPPPFGRFLEIGDAEWSLAHERVLMSAVRLVRAAVPELQRRGSGRILFLTAATIKRPSIPVAVTSTITRLGLAGLTKMLSRELAPLGILVNNLCPGWFDTGAFRGIVARAAEESRREAEEVLDGFLSRGTPSTAGASPPFSARTDAAT